MYTYVFVYISLYIHIDLFQSLSLYADYLYNSRLRNSDNAGPDRGDVRHGPRREADPDERADETRPAIAPVRRGNRRVDHLRKATQSSGLP